MSMTDPISDLLTRIRNAARAGHKKLSLPSSRLKRDVARLLCENSYLRSYAEVPATPQNQLVIRLRYTPQHESVIGGLERVSRPGLRRYGSAIDVRAMGRKLGLTIVSTSRGIMTHKEAAEQGIGGEILCRVW
jgi:small subunit ribosomal protein S8